MNKPPEGSQYIGDGVYALADQFGVLLYTYDGYEVTNAIYLEADSIRTITRLWQAQFEQRDPDA